MELLPRLYKGVLKRQYHYVIIVGILLYFSLSQAFLHLLHDSDEPKQQVSIIIKDIPKDSQVTTQHFEDLHLGPEVKGPKKPLTVIIVSYQRTGSTFLGNLFAQHPDSFYAFEPLDGLYVAMYGTSPGYNVPSDITTNWDGSPRSLTEDEITATADALDGLLNCSHMESLPLEVQLHDFCDRYKESQKNLHEFISCLQESKAVKFLTKECMKAANRMVRHCGTWFGKNARTMEVCHANLWPTSVRSQAKKPFKKYIECINKRRAISEKCVPTMENACRRSRIRATKVVRPTMQSLHILLDKYKSNLKVIHLFRKPHSVAKSRLRYSSIHGHSSKNDMSKEANLYCRDGAKDLLIRKDLELRYPNTFKTVIYEEFLKNPSTWIQDIYSFLGEEIIPGQVLSHFGNQKFVPDKRSGWNNPPNPSRDKIIDDNCKELYTQLNYHWK